MTPNDRPEARLFSELAPLSTLSGFAGALLLTENLALLENQLPLSDEKIIQLATPLLQLRQGLSQASREIEFLLLRLETEQYALVPIKTGLMLIRLNADADLDVIRKKALEIVKSLTPKINEISQAMIGEIFYTEASVATPTPAPVTTTTPTESISTAESEDDPRLNDYLKKTRSLLARVASASQVDRMFAKGFQAVGSTNGKLSKNQVPDFSEAIVSSISNPARRKMVAKEMLIVAKKIGL